MIRYRLRRALKTFGACALLASCDQAAKQPEGEPSAPLGEKSDTALYPDPGLTPAPAPEKPSELELAVDQFWSVDVYV